MKVTITRGTETVVIESPGDFRIEDIIVGNVVKVHIKKGQEITVTPASAIKGGVKVKTTTAARTAKPQPGGVIIIEIIDDI